MTGAPSEQAAEPAPPSLGARLRWPLLACLSLGLAPYLPLPHVLEKLTWLARGHPLRPIDVFDLLLHGAPWLWLASALLAHARARPRRS